MTVRKILLVLTALLFVIGGLRSQPLTVTVPAKVTGPPGWAEMRDQRGEKTKKFVSPDSAKVATVVGMEPIHYLDTLAGWVEVDLAVRDTTAGIYTHYVRPSDKWAIAYNDSGNFRFVHKAGALRFDPTFNRTNVDISFSFSANKMKAAYTLCNKNAPASLTWNWNFVPNGWSPTLQQIRTWVLNHTERPVAWDSTGASVPLSFDLTATSVTYIIDTAGAVYPIVVDPTVTNDTALAVDSITVAATDAGTTVADWKIARNMAIANQAPFTDRWEMEAGVDGGSTMWVMRGFLKFYIPELGTTLDSARMFIKPYQVFTAPDTLRFLEGTWTGYVTKASFNDFTGWPDSTAYDAAVNYIDSMTVTDDSVWSSSKFNAAGLAALDAKEADTLRMIMMHNVDYANDTTLAKINNNNRVFVYIPYANTKPYFIVYADGAPAAGGPTSVAGVASATSVSGVASPSKVAGVD